MSRSQWSNQRVVGAATTAFLVKSCVSCLFTNWKCTSNDGALSPIPGIGLQLDGAGGGSPATTACTFINPIFEGINVAGGVGIKLVEAQFCHFIGGTSEGNVHGVSIAASCYNNTFQDFSCEANSTDDIVCAGHDNSFINCGSNYVFSAAAYSNRIIGGVNGTVTFQSGAANNGIYGGYVTAVTIDAGAVGTVLSNISIATEANLTDNGTNTRYENVWDVANARYIKSPAKQKRGGQVGASTGTITIPVNTNFAGGAYTGILSVSNVQIANPTISTQTVFAVRGRGTSFDSTSLHTGNGAGGGCSFTVTCTTAGILIITNTNAGGTYLDVSWFGVEGF